MEVTKRFYQLLQDFESAGKPYVRDDLLKELAKVKRLINKLEILDNVSEEEETLQFTKLGSHPKRNAPFFMSELVNGCKEAQNSLTLLHLFAINHLIDVTNLMKFLDTYFRGLFKTTLFDLVALKSEAKSRFAKTFCQINNQNIAEEARAAVLKEIEDQFSATNTEYQWTKIDITATKFLKTFYIDPNTLQEESPQLLTDRLFAIKLTTHDNEELIILTDRPKKNILLEKTLTYNLLEQFPHVLQVVRDAIDITLHPDTYENPNEAMIRPLESMKIDYMDLVRKIFLKFLQEDFVLYFHAECAIWLPDSSSEESKSAEKDQSISKKRIEIRVLSPTSIQIENNFMLEMGAFSEEISQIWAKLSKYYSKIEDQEFDNIRRSYEAFNSRSFCLDFDKNLYLTFQNTQVPESLKKYINIGNFIAFPETRSHLVVLGSNVELLSKISEALQEAEKSRKPFMFCDKTYQDLRFQVIVKRKEHQHRSKKKEHVYSLSIQFFNDNPEEGHEIDLSLNLPSFTTRDRSVSSIRSSVKKLMTQSHFRKRSLTIHSAKEHDDLTFTPQAIESLKETIVSEYLPDEPTGLEFQVTPSRHWIRKFSTKSLMMSPENVPIFRRKSKITRHLTESPTQKKTFIKKKSTIRDDTIENLAFNSKYLDVYDDDEKKLSDWNFNVPKIANDMEKSRLVWFMLEDFGLINDFEINRDTLCEFILQIQAGYQEHNNPFHNYNHGVTVMHGCYYMLKNCGFKDSFSELINMGILIAAFCHDVGHRGKTNIFEVNSKSDIAITYHDRAVLEQYHAAYTFRVLSKEPYNIFVNLLPEDYRDIRKVIISCILATDMKEHFDGVKNLKLLMEGLKQMAGVDSPHLAKSAGKKRLSGAEPKDADQKVLEWSEADIMLITGTIVHASDLSGPTKNWELEYYFATQVNKEFIQQSEDEKALNLPITPYMLNLDKPSVMAKAEVQFIKFIIKPLWDTFNEFTGGALKIASDNLQDNLNKWEELYKKTSEEEEASKMKESKKGENQTEPKKEMEKLPLLITQRQNTIKEEPESP